MDSSDRTEDLALETEVCLVGGDMVAVSVVSVTEVLEVVMHQLVGVLILVAAPGVDV